MFKLNFEIDCPDGKYAFYCVCDEKLEYKVETDILGLDSKEGEISSDRFIRMLNDANIERWDRKYSGDNLIEDGIIWKLIYETDDRKYETEGYESYEPYNFEYLLSAIKLCDTQLEYFGW